MIVLLRKLVVVLLYFICFSTGIVNAQLNPPGPVVGGYPPASNCGIINGQVSVITPSPVCYQSVVAIHLSYAITLDFIYVTFGDGTDTIINNLPAGSVDITHAYNLQPSAKCLLNYPPGQPGTPCPISAYFYTTCGSNNYSYVSTTINSLVFRYKPKVELIDGDGNTISGASVVSCDSGCVYMPMDSSCTNTYSGVDFTDYTWYWGDGDSISFTNTTEDYFLNPAHCYQGPNSNPAYYVLKLVAENTCGVSVDSVKLFIQQIDDIQFPVSPYCTDEPVNIHITGSGGNGGQAYSTTISPTTGTVSGANTSNPTITFQVPGDYVITVRYGSCYHSELVSVSAGVDMTQTPIPPLCYTGSNELILSDWYSSSNTAQTNTFIVSDSAGIIFSNTSSNVPSSAIQLPHIGAYYIYHSSSTSCNSVVLIDTLVVVPQTVITPPTDTIVCIQTIFILPTISGTSRTLNGVATSDTFVAFPAGIYQVTYTPVCGPSVSSSITVIGSAAYGIDTVICFAADSIPLSGTRPGMIFTGSFISNNALNGISAGNGTHDFYAAYTDATGCTFRDTGTIEILPSMNAFTAFPDTSCEGVIVTMSNSNTTLQYIVNWGDGVSNGDSFHIYAAAGRYQIVATFTQGICDTTISDSIVIIPAPSAYFTVAPDSVCYGDTATITANLDPLYTYQWVYQGNTGSLPPLVVGDNTGNSILSTSVTLQGTSAYCPFVQQTDSLYMRPLTRAILDLNYSSSCNPMKVSLVNNSVVSNLSDNRFQWFINGQQFLDTTANVTSVDTLLAADYDSTYVFMLIATSCGTTDTVVDSVTVYATDFVPVIHANITECVHVPMSFSSSAIPSCTVSYAFGDGTFGQTTSVDTIMHQYDSHGYYTVVMTMACECQTASDTLIINILPGPIISVNAPLDACDDAPVNLTSNVSGPISAGTFSSSFGDGTYNFGAANPVHVYSEPGNYDGWMLARGINGCLSDTAEFSITVYELPSVHRSFNDTFACSGTIMPLSLDTPCANCTYIWTSIHNDEAAQITTYDASLPFFADDVGDYFVSVYAFNNNQDSCVASSDTFAVSVYQSPHAFFTIEAGINDKDLTLFEYNNLSTPLNNTYWWNFGDSSFSASPSPSAHGYPVGEYVVTLTAYNGPCYHSMDAPIRVSPYPQLYIPNAFTPNADGQNDFFQVFGGSAALDFLNISVYDRIGEKVFESYDLNFLWDGTYKGTPLTPGVYIYRLETSGVDDEEITPTQGSITLIR